MELNVGEDLELPLVWLLTTVFLSIWKLRLDKIRVQLYEVRAQLEAINLLRETRFRNATVLLDQFVDNYFLIRLKYKIGIKMCSFLVPNIPVTSVYLFQK